MYEGVVSSILIQVQSLSKKLLISVLYANIFLSKLQSTIQHALINVKSSINRNLQINISNASGNLLLTKQQTINTGENNFLIPISQLPNGVLFVTVKDKENNKNAKIIITCKIHGDFEQKPYCHLNGNGCYMCCKNHKLNTIEFIEKAKLIHGDKYDYSKVDYKYSNENVIITLNGVRQIPAIDYTIDGTVLEFDEIVSIEVL